MILYMSHNKPWLFFIFKIQKHIQFRSAIYLIPKCHPYGVTPLALLRRGAGGEVVFCRHCGPDPQSIFYNNNTPNGVTPTTIQPYHSTTHHPPLALLRRGAGGEVVTPLLTISSYGLCH